MRYMLLFFIVFSFNAYSSCYGLNGDAKKYCLATEMQNANNCNQIKDIELKNTCLAKQNEDKNPCNKIQNYNARKNCLDNLR